MPTPQTRPSMPVRSTPVSPLPPSRTVAENVLNLISPQLHEAKACRRLAHEFTPARVTAAGGAMPGKALVDGVDRLKDRTTLVTAPIEAAKFQKESLDARRALGAMAVSLKSSAQSTMDFTKLMREHHIARVLAQHGSEAARSSEVFIANFMQEARHSVAESRQHFLRAEAVFREFRQSPSSSLGKLALKVEKVLEQNARASSLLRHGKILVDPRVSNGLTGIGGLVSTYKTYHESDEKNQAWKVARAGAAGGATIGADVALATAVKMGRLNPATLLIDPAIKLSAHGYTQMRGMSEKDAEKFKKGAEGFTLGKFAEGVADNIVSVAKVLCTFDGEPLNDLHRRNISGENGRILQGSAMIGQVYADLPINQVDPLLVSLAKDVNTMAKGEPADFKEARIWWAAAKETVVTTATSAMEAGHGLVITGKELAGRAQEKLQQKRLP